MTSPERSKVKVTDRDSEERSVSSIPTSTSTGPSGPSVNTVPPAGMVIAGSEDAGSSSTTAPVKSGPETPTSCSSSSPPLTIATPSSAADPIS